MGISLVGGCLYLTFAAFLVADLAAGSLGPACAHGGNHGVHVSPCCEGNVCDVFHCEFAAETALGHIYPCGSHNASLTQTMAAFLATGISDIMPIATFGIFAGCLVLFNYLLDIFMWPSVVVIWDRTVKRKEENCFKCRCCRRNKASQQVGAASVLAVPPQPHGILTSSFLSFLSSVPLTEGLHTTSFCTSTRSCRGKSLKHHCC